MTVNVYRSTDSNAPVLSGTAGALITVLNACLVNGYGQVTLTSLTSTGTTATATVSGGHGFSNGIQATMAGANAAGYNGTFQITVVSPTVYTYTVASGLTSPDTSSTITAIRTSAGWTLPYTSGSTGAVYKQGAGSNGFYLNVDDTGSLVAANHAKVRAFESMTAWSNGTYPLPGRNPFPSDAYQYQGGTFFKSSAANSTAIPWILIAKSTSFHLWINAYLQGNVATQAQAYFFGDFPSFQAGDKFNTFLVTNGPSSLTNYDTYWGSLNASGVSTNANYFSLARSWHQIGSCQGCYTAADASKSQMFSFPLSVDGNMWCAPVTLVESVNAYVPRGTVPGIWATLNSDAWLTEGQQITFTSGDLNGKTLECHFMNPPGISSPTVAQASPWLYEISNTW